MQETEPTIITPAEMSVRMNAMGIHPESNFFKFALLGRFTIKDSEGRWATPEVEPGKGPAGVPSAPIVARGQDLGDLVVARFEGQRTGVHIAAPKAQPAPATLGGAKPDLGDIVAAHLEQQRGKVY